MNIFVTVVARDLKNSYWARQTSFTITAEKFEEVKSHPTVVKKVADLKRFFEVVEVIF